MIRPIKVGMLVSYDYDKIKNSLPPLYEYADKIVLAVDKDGKTWAGHTFIIPETFFQWINDFDKQHKVEIYRDSFYMEELTSMQCETRERNMLAKYMGEGGWHIQVDADEYFVDFGDFVNFLHKLDEEKPHITQVGIAWLILYKKITSGYLFVKSPIVRNVRGLQVIATTNPKYVNARKSKNTTKIYYPQRIIHDSWARDEQEILTKLNNWGHNADFDTEQYFNYWKAINEKNYKYFRNIHPVNPELWKELDYIKAEDISSLLKYLRENKENDLLKIEKGNRITQILKLCIPPIFGKIKGYIKAK